MTASGRSGESTGTLGRLTVAVLLAGVVWFVDALPGGVGRFEPARLSLNYGFLLLEAYLLGEVCAGWRLPRLSGYILTGVLFGPDLLGFISHGWVGQMGLIDDLALTFIALSAGAELRLDVLRIRKRTIGWLCGAGIVGTVVGVAAAVVWVPGLLPFEMAPGAARVWVAAGLIGVVSVARSPTSAIAIIDECRAAGPFTDTVFGVTVAIDTLVIVLFATTVAFGEALVRAAGVDLAFLAVVMAQLLLSIVAGAGLGWGVAFYVRRIRRELPVFLVVLSFLITESSAWLSHALAGWFGATVHLEPLLVATAAGFFVRNATAQGERLAEALHGVSLPIFVVFFSMAGVGLDVVGLGRIWPAAVGLVALRALFLSVTSYLGARVAGESKTFSGWSGLAFYTQAGVSLGLAQEISRRFPGWGGQITTLLVAGIAINQVLGPVVFKLALDRMGETGKAP